MLTKKQLLEVKSPNVQIRFFSNAKPIHQLAMAGRATRLAGMQSHKLSGTDCRRKQWGEWRAICLMVVVTIGVCVCIFAYKAKMSNSASLSVEKQQVLPPTREHLPPAYSTADASSHPNVIWIIADALRADHISSYGYARPTTPHLDTLVANQGVRFSDVTSTAAWTRPANAAMVSGLNPTNLEIRWEDMDATLPEEVNTLAEYLHDAGYYTAGFVHGVIGSGLGFAQGFDLYVDSFPHEPGRWDKIPADQINSYAIDWLENTWLPDLSGDQPLFLFLYHFDPHTWYDPPPPYDTLYDSTYTGTLTSDVYQHGKIVVSGQTVPTERDVEHLIALYDGEISYWDAQLEQMLAYLENIHLLDDALIVVTSDHGEMFGEHNKWAHRNSLYEEVIRVPLLMRYTGVISPGIVIETPVQSMDIMPTVLDFAGLPIPTELDAVSLRALIQGGTVVVRRDVFSEQNGITDPTHPAYWLAPRVDLRSIRRDTWKLIHQMGDLSADELYLLQPSSVYETDNRVLTEPELAQELRQDLLDWMGKTFTITGQIADVNGTPFADVEVASKDGLSTTTAATGVYTFANLAPGDYTLTPTLTSYAFCPPTQTVSLPPDVSGQKFVILPSPVSTTLSPGVITNLFYTDTQGQLTQLEFPANAVTQSTSVILTPNLVANGLGVAFAGHAFELDAYQGGTLQTNLIFGASVTVTIHYSDNDVRFVTDQNQLVLQWRTGHEWQDATQTCNPITTYRRDVANKVLEVPICQPGQFGLFGPTRDLYLPLVLRNKL